MKKYSAPTCTVVRLPPAVLGEPPSTLAEPTMRELLGDLPGGPRTFWGIPFELTPSNDPARWLWVGPGAEHRARVPIESRATYLVLAHLVIASASPAFGMDASARLMERYRDVGEPVARYRMRYADGTEHEVAIRRYFEIGNLPTTDEPFMARPHESVHPLDWRGPAEPGLWGEHQQAVGVPWTVDWRSYELNRRALPMYWLYALENPRPEIELEAFIAEGSGSTPVAIAGITLYHGAGNPLRHRALETFRLDIRPGPTESVASIDLGIVARQYRVTPIEPTDWIDAANVGWGGPIDPQPTTTSILVDVAAADAATIQVGEDRIQMADVVAAGTVGKRSGGTRVEWLTPRRRWATLTVTDAATGQPTACRVQVRTSDGRYWPPYGHRREVNDHWFEDYGADLRLGDTQFAYVDGTFDIELPIGEVLIEAVKGFEYQPLRTIARVEEGTAKVSVQLERVMDWRERGWISADTHVHFLSPQTAWLEARAEGVNVVNILASQWGDLFTSFGDYTGAPSGVSADDTLIWVGTENRQHVLGHLSLLGTSRYASPVSAGGPSESYIGDPVWSSLAEWADESRSQGGLAISPHFPYPYGEVVADVILGKVDGVELRDFGWGIDSYAVREWYRLLNCGFRVAAVGGTDKMSAGMPLGGVRTFAWIGDAGLSFGAWAEAVRAGRTMTSSGPLIDLRVDGRMVGDVVKLPPGGGTLEVVASARAVTDLGSLEIVLDGRVIECVVGRPGQRRLELSTRVHVTGTGWIAARCQGPTLLYHEWPVMTAAHTSPVYLDGPEARVANSSDRVFLSTMLEGGLAWLDSLATRADPQRHDRIRAVFVDARRRLDGS